MSENERWRFDLSKDEVYWRDHQPWLLSRGYQLRERYQPDWIASWVKKPWKVKTVTEDGLRRRPGFMDAIRLKDGKLVIFKRINRRDPYINEKDIAAYFSSDERRNDPMNHCIPIFEVLEVPGDESHVLIVMPLLKEADSPCFETIGEVVDFIWQAFLGVQFMHRHHVAHRDCCWQNIGMDASELYPMGFHPVLQQRDFNLKGSAIQKYTRTQRPPKYYWFDFGLSCRFKENVKPLAAPIRGNDRSVPEFKTLDGMDTAYDPFPTDIYYLGNMIREVFLDGDGNEIPIYQPILGLDFMRPLITEMVRENPADRPTIDQAVEHLRRIISSLSKRKLQSPVLYKEDNRLAWTISHFVPYTIHQISYLLNRIHPIPSREGAIKPY